MIRFGASLLFVGGISLATADEVAAVTEVVFKERAEMEAAFAAGQSLVTGPPHTVSAGRRDKVGVAEIHENVTAIFYFKSGRAPFVTGGELVEVKPTQPGEWRGAAIQGGTSRAVTAGEMIVVPLGTCHWFSAIEGVIEYYLVKVVA